MDLKMDVMDIPLTGVSLSFLLPETSLDGFALDSQPVWRAFCYVVDAQGGELACLGHNYGHVGL